MFKKILFGLAALFIILAIVVATRPADFHVSRSITIAAPPSAAFSEVNDFHRWSWNPWGKIDPNMKQSYEGPASGVGASYTWAGNNQVGEGRMTISESQPDALIRIKMDFFKPFAGTSMAEFMFKPQDQQTLVTWSMSGKNNFIAKAMGLFMNMEKMIGDQFEKGLVDLKSIVENKTR
jgi:hypothetical protein